MQEPFSDLDTNNSSFENQTDNQLKSNQSLIFNILSTFQQEILSYGFKKVQNSIIEILADFVEGDIERTEMHLRRADNLLKEKRFRHAIMEAHLAISCSKKRTNVLFQRAILILIQCKSQLNYFCQAYELLSLVPAPSALRELLVSCKIYFKNRNFNKVQETLNIINSEHIQNNPNLAQQAALITFYAETMINIDCIKIAQSFLQKWLPILVERQQSTYQISKVYCLLAQVEKRKGVLLNEYWNLSSALVALELRGYTDQNFMSISCCILENLLSRKKFHQIPPHLEKMSQLVPVSEVCKSQKLRQIVQSLPSNLPFTPKCHAMLSSILTIKHRELNV